MKDLTQRGRYLRRGLAGLAVTLTAGAAALAVGPLAAHAAVHSQASSYTFATHDNAHDPTFNQLLGINSKNVIAGYYGSGATGSPNKGYLLQPPYAQSNYVNENFPHSQQTQVTALNNDGDTAGFWVNAQGTNEGFIRWNGVYASYTDPNTPKGAGSVNQILGINDSGIAVGFWVNKQGNSRAFSLDQATGVFTPIIVPGTSWAATGINNNGDIVGFSTGSKGATSSWLMHNGQLVSFQYPGGSDTQAFGVNDSDEIVGTYLNHSGVQHGFVLTDPLGPTSHWQTVDDPNGIGDTFINGLNDAGDLVGFYCASATMCNSFLATP
jgi:probable HAF family extracellular repeat protein